VRQKGQSILNAGDLSIMSFHATKVFNTFEGGAIVSPDAKTKQRIDYLKNFGFADEVTVVAAGINGKMSEINAAFGLLQLKHVDRALQRRREIDALYRQLLRGVPGITPVQPTGQDEPNCSYFPILVDERFALSRDALYEMMRNHEIFARRYFYPLISSFPMYRGLSSAVPANLAVATRLSNQVICLPIYPDLSDEDVRRVAALIRASALVHSKEVTAVEALAVEAI
jgi:dTDP-4-amino-4,6-dideoxygalactose transaminase